MKVVLLAPEFAVPADDISRTLRHYLGALAADAAHTALALVSRGDSTEDLDNTTAVTARRAVSKPLQTFGAEGQENVFLRAAWRAGSGAARIICGDVALLAVASLALRPGARLGLVAHGEDAWPRLSGLRRLALGRVHRIFCPSAGLQERLATAHPELAPRLRVLPHALDAEWLAGPAPTPPPADRAPVVLCAGAFRSARPDSDGELLLRAFTLLPRSAFHHQTELMPRLRFIGHGDAFPRLRRLAAELHLAERVDFGERPTEAERRQAFLDCTCLAAPGPLEDSAAACLDALASGRPCVGVHSGATPSYAGPGLGLLAPAGDPVALAATLAECLSRVWDPAVLRSAALAHSPDRLATALQHAWR